jgi:hypothetical protein
MQAHFTKHLETRTTARVCTTCGIALDSEYFDDSGVTGVPEFGQEVTLARFDLPPQYCGVLEYFAQFTDQHAQHPQLIATPGLQWLILMNNRPLYPYTNLERIVNPWGNGSFQVFIRLDVNAIIEFKVRCVNRASRALSEITTVGGRILGRYWYTTTYGDVV